MTESVLELLPPRLRDIAEVIGLDAVLALSNGWPGIRLFIPAQMTPQHPIALRIGFEAASKLAQMCAGETIAVPRNHRLLRAQLRAEVVTRFRAKESAATLAREYGVHEFTIYRWAGAAPVDTKQPGLFDGS